MQIGRSNPLSDGGRDESGEPAAQEPALSLQFRMQCVQLGFEPGIEV